jgi:CheY-like chemotaxis protein
MLLNIVYLDDEPMLCEIFVDFFSAEDRIVRTFTDPNEAIASMRANPPDVLFIDYRLPGTTGDLVAQSLDPNIPKYLITGDITVNTTYQFKRVLPKPVDESVIGEILTNVAAA